MKSKKEQLASLVMALMIVSCGRTEDLSARAKWTATVKVMDEFDQPVAWADVTIGYYVPPPPDQTIALDSVKGKTDTNGLFSASGQTRSTDLFFGAGKDGYYRSHFEHAFHKFNESDPAKRNPDVTLLLKKIRHPIAMYAKSVNLGMPIYEKPVGFDLMAGDWIAPHGQGMDPDILFTGHFDKRPDGESDYTLTVSFPRQGDGIQEFSAPESEGGSGLRSPYEAPVDGYQSNRVQTDYRKPGRPIETNRDEKHNYFFRVRTVLDENGNVKSAHYGKIYGDFMQFTYYLNPTSNDRNIEFDPARNLLTGLKSFEQVAAP